MNRLRVNIAAEVRKKRQELTMTQEQLAGEIEKSPSFVGQFERGETSLKIETLEALIKCLWLDLNSLFLDEPPSENLVNEMCMLASQLDEKKLRFLIGFAKLLRHSEL